MIKANYYETEEITICPYCVTQTDTPCCGENHNETGYLYQDNAYLESEIEIVKPILSIIKFETKYYLIIKPRIVFNRLKFKTKRLVESLYKCSIRPILIGLNANFQYSKLDVSLLNLVNGKVYKITEKRRKELKKD